MFNSGIDIIVARAVLIIVQCPHSKSMWFLQQLKYVVIVVVVVECPTQALILWLPKQVLYVAVLQIRKNKRDN